VMSSILSRAGIVSASVACFLLGVLIYARLTGYDLGISAITRNRAGQAALFFVLLNATLVLAAVTMSRAMISTGYSLGMCVRDAVMAGVGVGVAVLVACLLADGHLGDLPQFVRFEVASISRILAPAFALGAYLVTRRGSQAHLPADMAARWILACAGIVSALILVAALVYLSGKVIPWPEPMFKQLLIVMCGLVGPALVLTVMALTMKNAVRVLAVLGVLGIGVAAALL